MTYNPTRKSLQKIDKDCEKAKCNSLLSSWSCKDCRISDRCEKILGFRLEDLPYEILIEDE